MKKLQHFLKTGQGKIVASFIILIIALFAYYFYELSKGRVVKTQDIIISETDHVRGAQTGTITMVEFGDFQCPACGAYEPIVRKVVADNHNTLKIVFRHFPLTTIHQNSLLAAKASEAASIQGKFWEMHDMLYDHQADWSGSLNAHDLFMSYAKDLNLDQVKFNNDLNSKAIEDKILAEYKEGVNLGVNSTPSFFINGVLIKNPQSLEAFETLIKNSIK